MLVRVDRGGQRPPVQFAVHRDAFLHREQRGQGGHAVGRGSDGRPPVGGGFAGPVRGTVRVESLRPGPGFAFGASITPAMQAVGDGGVDLGALLLAQVSCFPGDDGSPPLTGVTALQCPQHTRHSWTRVAASLTCRPPLCGLSRLARATGSDRSIFGVVRGGCAVFWLLGVRGFLSLVMGVHRVRTGMIDQ